MQFPGTSSSARGQTLVIVAAAMVAVVGMVGLVVDVGMQWAGNRASQNGSDATAEAGAIVLMERMLGATTDDDDVLAAVNAAATLNGVNLEIVEYTDWEGTPLNAEVGAGAIPDGAQGVRVVGNRVHETVFARIVGVTELEVFTDAVAVTGPTEVCAPGAPCALLPVTVPTTVVTCDGQNRSVATDDEWPEDGEQVIPLCGNNPGSVGWIDWSPPGGGDSELAAQLCDPNPPYPIILPDWFNVTSTGNTNSAPIDDCFSSHIGDEIMIPLFEDTCRTDPGEATECTDPAPIGGQNQWYYFPRAASLLLTGVYISGTNPICDTGNGATSCITGIFIDTAIEGEVSGPWNPDDDALSQFFAVQLIR
jgi:hypothetical protein